MGIKSVVGIMQVVSDLEKMVPFYTQLLEFTEHERVHWPEEVCQKLFKINNTKATIANLQLGNESLFLIQFTPNQAQPHLETFSNDHWFQHIAIVVSDMEKAYARLMQNSVTAISESYQTIPASNPAAGGIKAFYFKSLDGHPLELIYYPPGKGKPEWQNKKSLFLGIDHTAIVVRNTEASAQFYRETLGMEKIGESINSGEEQDKLANLLHTKVQITSYAYSQGMAVEFLEYLSPLGGRRRPKTEIPHLVETQTVIVVGSLKIKPIHLTFTQGTTLVDPDGHRLLLITMS